MRVSPVLWFAQNTDVSLIPTAVASPANPFVDPMRPRAIDLPQRFGTDPVARLDPGESEAVLAWRGTRVALTTGARQIGIGPYHSILMSPDAPGFPRIELGTSAPIASPLGDFAVTLSAGRLAQTRWSPQERTGARSGSFIEGRWRPLSSDRLELGAARFYHRDWRGVRLSDFTAPFSSLFFDWASNSSGEIDNQLLALFGAIRIPEAGIEFWAEFGRNDGASSLRDLGVELEHNSAWLFGMQKVWRDQSQNLWALNATGASARTPQIADFRGQATFYEHTPIAQGHTVRGQLLGTSLLERTGGGEVRLDRYSPEGRLGVIVATRALPQVRALEVPEARLRQEWSALLEILRAHPRGFHWFTRAGLIADLNRHPTLGDAYNLTISTGITLRP